MFAAISAFVLQGALISMQSDANPSPIQIPAYQGK